MALLTDQVFAFYRLDTGTPADRTIEWTLSGTYDPDGLEPDERPVAGVDYDAAIYGWYVLPELTPVEVPDALDTDVLQDVTQKLDTTTGTATTQIGNASMRRRQRAVKAILHERGTRLEALTGLTSLLKTDRFADIRARIQRIRDVETDLANWATSPEDALSDPLYTEPAETLDTTPLIERAAGLLADGSLLRPKLAARATYDFNQAIGLGPFPGTTTLTQVALLDIGAIPRGNVWAFMASFEGRHVNASSNQLTVRGQMRYMRAGTTTLSGWIDDIVFGPSVFTTTFDMFERGTLFGGGYDDLEYRIVYSTTANGGLFNPLRNVYLTAVRLTISE